MGDTKEWARNGSFMKKPATGWLHDDAALSNGDGVYYPVKYVGSIPMECSMRTMRFEDRTEVTREAITLVCEAAGIKPPKKRKVSKLVRQSLTEDPVVKMLNVKLTISTAGIALVVIETNQVIANHIMPNVSFATGGHATEYDTIGYVAKDQRNKREVHVFDCGHMAHDCIATVGQAFELRYKAFLKKGANQQQLVQQMQGMGLEEDNYGDLPYDQAGYTSGGHRPGPSEQLYDDLPEGNYGGGSSIGGYSANSSYRDATYDNAGGKRPPPGPGMYGDDPTYDMGSNDPVYDNAGGKPQINARPPVMYGGGDEPVYDAAGNNFSNSTGQYGSLPSNNSTYGTRDYDDGVDDSSANLMKAPGGGELNRPLKEEPWFHGTLRREEADELLQAEGEFLVRESAQTRGQYILSALQNGRPKHLLLVDPAGRVRTKDMTFDGVSHLINYHIRARIPIVSRGSRVSLGDYVPKSGYSTYDAAS